jgi:L-fucose isomerase-like protein
MGRYLGNIYDQGYVRKVIKGLRTEEGRIEDFEKGCEILQIFIVSESERDFVSKVKKKLLENEELSEQLKNVKQNLETGIVKKGQLGHQRGEVEKKMEFEVRNYENKLEKANQKLNLSITKNKELRIKIDLMRKEKNIIQKIYQ